MKIRTIFFLVLYSLTTSIFLQSCQTVDKNKVKEIVINFFYAYRDNDFLQASSIYPNIVYLKGDFRKSSSIDIELKDIIVVNENNIIVNITHHWINPWGVDNTARMKLYIEKQGETYKILDTKNFCIYDNVKLYKFACKTGAIDLMRDTTDVSISKKISDVKYMYDLFLTATKYEIAKGLNINKGWKWESGYYSDYASGRAVVTNNSIYPIKQPKYKITYCKSDNTVVTTDEGCVCYDILMPGQSKSFSWYTSYIGDATKAKVTVICDDEAWIEDIILNMPFDGSEYEKYNQNVDCSPYIR